jgi:hypothetical protein
MAAVLALVGYLLRFRHWGWLVSGYNTSSREAKERYDVIALTTGVGRFVFLLAALVFLAGVGDLAGLGWVRGAAFAALGVAVIAFLVYANTGGRYLKRP